MILENNKELKLRDLINYSCQLYSEQNINFNSKNVQKDLSEFFHDRFKNFMKEKEIRNDIIESVTSNYNIDNILKIYKKTLILNKLISKEIGKDVMFSYKRASNIISNELKNNKIELTGSADSGLFKNEFEKILYKKIHEIRKDFTSIGRDDDYESILKTLSSARKEVNEFFENVIVNDEDELIKKNRLELLQMLCKTFDDYLNFSKIESL
jgi:glycyl-tRNA synthetase beta chain